jgi:hypothetical protein
MFEKKLIAVTVDINAERLEQKPVYEYKLPEIFELS